MRPLTLLHTAPAESTPLSGCSSVAERDNFTDRDLVVIARMIDWQLGDLREANALRLAGKIDAALEAVAGSMRRRLASGAIQPLGPVLEGTASKQSQDIMQGRVSLLQHDPVEIGWPIDWFTRSDEDAQWTVHLSYMYWINPLADAFAQTGDEAFAERWLGVVEDFLANMAYGSPILEYNPARPIVLNHSKTCNNGESWGSPDAWISLSCHIRTDTWIYGLQCLANSRSLTSPRLLRIAASLCDDHIHVMLANPRENTPNQFLAISSSLVKLGVALPEFKASIPAFLEGERRLQRAVENSMTVDGGDLEQSVNYNVRFCAALREIASYLERDAPERAEFFNQAARRRALFLAALTTPTGNSVPLAKTGLMTMVSKLEEWSHDLKLPELLHVATGGREGPAPAFASAGFPYSGYYVMRSGWSRDADYLFFKTSSNGLGHMHEDCLSLHLCAGGRELLTDSGNFSYTTQTPLDKAMNAYSHASASHSTVLVNGHGQCRQILRKSRSWNHDEAPKLRACNIDPLSNRTVHGRWFELAEGSYDDGYGPLVDMHARHHRTVVWIKRLGWLMVDRLSGVADRELSAVWTLAPAFPESCLRLNDGLVIAEADDRAFTLAPLCSAPHSIDVQCGIDDPAAGWFFPKYGQRVPKPDIHVRWKSFGDSTLGVTLLLPRADITVRGSMEVNGNHFDAAWDLAEVGAIRAYGNASAQGNPELHVTWTSVDGSIHELTLPSTGDATESGPSHQAAPKNLSIPSCLPD